MKYKRLRREVEVGDKGTRWIQPVMRGYKLGCCDCDLVHHVDFRVVHGRVQYRARRAPRYTARERAKRLLTR